MAGPAPSPSGAEGDPATPLPADRPPSATDPAGDEATGEGVALADVIDGDHPRPDRRTLDTQGAWDRVEPVADDEDPTDRPGTADAPTGDAAVEAAEDRASEADHDVGAGAAHDGDGDAATEPPGGNDAEESRTEPDGSTDDAADVDRYADSPGAALVQGRDPVEPNEPA